MGIIYGLCLFNKCQEMEESQAKLLIILLKETSLFNLDELCVSF
jgi:hypothetical protein